MATIHFHQLQALDELVDAVLALHSEVGCAQERIDTSAPNPGKYFPAAGSVRGRILGALLRREKLTPLDALRRFGNFRLAAAIEFLRKRGWHIRTEMVCVTTSDRGRQVDVARYSLPDQDIVDAGEEGQYFAVAAEIAERRRRRDA